MITLRWIKITRVLFFLYVSLCVLILSLFFLANVTDSRSFFDLGNDLVPFWLFMPCHTISGLAGLITYGLERRNPEVRKLILGKWHTFIWIILATPLLWIVTSCLIIALTGGV